MKNCFIKFILLTITTFGLVFLSGCKKDELSLNDNYTLELNPRLDTTNEGYYRLELTNSNISDQTIHRISGFLKNNGVEPDIPQKVKWESSHTWTLQDTTHVIVRRTINALGQWTTIDTISVTQFSGFIVPTINSTSYSGTNGEINTVIAPINNMQGDTMIVKCNFKYTSEVIKIVLE